MEPVLSGPPGDEWRFFALQLENPPNPKLPREREAARSLSGRIERVLNRTAKIRGPSFRRWDIPYRLFHFNAMNLCGARSVS